MLWMKWLEQHESTLGYFGGIIIMENYSGHTAHKKIEYSFTLISTPSLEMK